MWCTVRCPRPAVRSRTLESSTAHPSGTRLVIIPPSPHTQHTDNAGMCRNGATSLHECPNPQALSIPCAKSRCSPAGGPWRFAGEAEEGGGCQQRQDAPQRRRNSTPEGCARRVPWGAVAGAALWMPEPRKISEMRRVGQSLGLRPPWSRHGATPLAAGGVLGVEVVGGNGAACLQPAAGKP